MKKHVNYNFLEGVCCYFNCGDKTILGKKTSDIGIGLWDGYGGKIKHKETPEEAGVRELREEAEVFVLPKHLKKVGEIYFHNTRYGKIIFTFKVHIFFVIQWGGYPKETEEMKSPTEFLKDKLPYKKMMASDKDWLPHIMRGEKLLVHSFIGQKQRKKTGKTLIESIESFAK